MYKLLSPKFLFVIFSIFVLTGLAAAQDPSQPADVKPPVGVRQQPKRPNLMKLLGLSPDQMEQLRKINQDRKPQMDIAAIRLRMANRALDEVIYADIVDEAQFQAKLKELQMAQANMARLRFTGELQIRQILTPDQLTHFRELRRRFQNAGPKPNGPLAGPRAARPGTPPPPAQNPPK
jgi:Spy/CpxP family protein refolding chaperone